MTQFQWPEQGPLPLDVSVEDWEALADTIRDFLAEKLAELGTQPVANFNDIPAMPSDPLGEGLPAYLATLYAGGFNPGHPGFMAYIPGGGLVTSALAEWVIRTLNYYGTASFAAPTLIDLERQVVETFAGWVGYDAGAGGVLTTGGSLANFTAMVTARRSQLPEDFLSGVLYCSGQTHHSVTKAANLAGFSARNVRELPVDAAFRLQPRLLAEQIQADRADGLMPFLVISSAGTTNTGSVDPLNEIADICEAEGLWHHVDAAYGGAFLLTKRGRDRLAGIHRSDSVTLDPHKGLFLPYGTGGLVVRNRQHLIEAHELRGEYMPDLDQAQAHPDPFSLSVELSREHRGLKVALPLLLHGQGAFEASLDEKLDLAESAYEQLKAIPELEVLHAPDLTTVAFRISRGSDADNRALMDGVNAGGLVFISATILNGQFALRISILNHRTRQAHVDTAVNEVRRALAELGG